MDTKFNPLVVYRTVELFLEYADVKKPADAVVEKINEEFKVEKFNRESVYKVVAYAKQNGFFRLVPPVEKVLEEKLSNRFTQYFGRFSVVSTHQPTDNARVAEVAASYVLDLILKIGKTRATNTVGLGLGPGRATHDFCHYFGMQLKSSPLFPKLRLVAISAGCPATLPEYASSSFFHSFPKELIEEKIGLFAESLVRVKDFSRIKKTPGVHEAFDARKKDLIDVVVTSMGDFSDPHDIFAQFLADAGMTSNDINKKKWIGNVQYRPYTANGPVSERANDWRAVTLFELQDLVEMSKLNNKHVVLIARQCGAPNCGRTRAKALLPLLTNPDLRVFNQLFLDSATARDLLSS